MRDGSPPPSSESSAYSSSDSRSSFLPAFSAAAASFCLAAAAAAAARFAAWLSAASPSILLTFKCTLPTAKHIPLCNSTRLFLPPSHTRESQTSGQPEQKACGKPEARSRELLGATHLEPSFLAQGSLELCGARPRV